MDKFKQKEHSIKDDIIEKIEKGLNEIGTADFDISRDQIEKIIEDKEIEDVEIINVPDFNEMKYDLYGKNNKLVVCSDGTRTAFQYNHNGVYTYYKYDNNKLNNTFLVGKNDLNTIVVDFCSKPTDKIDAKTFFLREYSNEYLEKISTLIKENKTSDYKLSSKDDLNRSVIEGHNVLSYDIKMGTEWSLNSNNVINDTNYALSQGIDTFKNFYLNKKKYAEQDNKGWIDEIVPNDTIKR